MVESLEISEDYQTTSTEQNSAQIQLKRKTHTLTKAQSETDSGKANLDECSDCGKYTEFAVNRKEGTIVCTSCGLV